MPAVARRPGAVKRSGARGPDPDSVAPRCCLECRRALRRALPVSRAAPACAGCARRGAGSQPKSASPDDWNGGGPVGVLGTTARRARRERTAARRPPPSGRIDRRCASNCERPRREGEPVDGVARGPTPDAGVCDGTGNDRLPAEPTSRPLGGVVLRPSSGHREFHAAARGGAQVVSAGRLAAMPAGTGQPRTLVTSDVTAEGLDLQVAGRVVHYDLPWTDVRLGQREGRAVRRGSNRREVEIIRFLPTPALEERLHQQARLVYKAKLPRLLGLDTGGRHIWGWRREVADDLPGRGVEGVAAIRSECGGILAGVALERDGARVVINDPLARRARWMDCGPGDHRAAAPTGGRSPSLRAAPEAGHRGNHRCPRAERTRSPPRRIGPEGVRRRPDRGGRTSRSAAPGCRGRSCSAARRRCPGTDRTRAALRHRRAYRRGGRDDRPIDRPR